MSESGTVAVAPPAPVSRWQAFGFWLKLGFIGFGGPAGQIAILHQELVVRRRWISERRFLHALNYCMVLPGPEAQQLATYLGWLMHRSWGGVIVGALFVLPYVFQGAVGHYGWLSAAQMLDGLALGETTPGPLIMVVAFVGFIGGHGQLLLGPDHPFWSGAMAAVVVTWFTFLPSFLFILVGEPLVEATHDAPRRSRYCASSAPCSK